MSDKINIKIDIMHYWKWVKDRGAMRLNWSYQRIILSCLIYPWRYKMTYLNGFSLAGVY